MKEVLATLVHSDKTFYQQEDKEILLYGDSDWRARDFIISFGTEFVRDNIGANFWVDLMAQQLTELKVPTIVVIDDIRYPNESKLVQSLGIAVLIQRPGVKKVIQHRSEQPDQLLIRTVVENSNTPQQTAEIILDIAQTHPSWPLKRPS